MWLHTHTHTHMPTCTHTRAHTQTGPKCLHDHKGGWALVCSSSSLSLCVVSEKLELCQQELLLWLHRHCSFWVAPRMLHSTIVSASPAIHCTIHFRFPAMVASNSVFRISYGFCTCYIWGSLIWSWLIRSMKIMTSKVLMIWMHLNSAPNSHWLFQRIRLWN